jgi:long-chain acyl-CoA synthetase
MITLSASHLVSPELLTTLLFCILSFAVDPAPGIQTIHDILLYAARTHGNKPALAHRPIKNIITETKQVPKTDPNPGEETTQEKKWEYYELGGFEWVGYQGLLDRVRDVGLGLRELGVGSRGQEFFNIYGQTR